MPMDLTSFLQQTVRGEMSTHRTPCPEGEYAMQVVSDPERCFSFQNGERDDGTTWEKVNIFCEVLDDGVKAQLERDSVTVRYPCWIDYDEAGGLSSEADKNIGIGQLREAVGQNNGEMDWSPQTLIGAGPFLGRVDHSPNEKDPENPYCEVTRVVAIS